MWLLYQVRNALACLLTAFCALIIVYGLSLDCNVSKLGGLYGEPFLLLACFFVLFVNEGYQVGLLGVKSMDERALAPYPRAKKIKALIFGDGDKLPRLFLGQSFMVVACTFLISHLTTFINFPSVEGVPEGVMDVFVRSGFPGAIVTVNIVQLLPSILAQEFPAQFLHHTPTVYTIVQAALLIESLGIVRFTYVAVAAAEKMYFLRQSAHTAGLEDTPLAHTDRDLLGTIKVVCSTLLAMGCAGFLLYSILMGYSIIPLPGVLLLLLLLAAYVLVFYCEGLKIAIVGSGHLSRTELQARQYPVAIHDALSFPEGIPRFLLGRQLIVVPMGFLVANITQFDEYSGLLSPGLFLVLVGLGIPGMLVTMQVAQLAPQVLGSAHTGAFLRLPGALGVVYLALGVELLGLTQCAFLLKGLVSLCARGKGGGVGTYFAPGEEGDEEGDEEEGDDSRAVELLLSTMSPFDHPHSALKHEHEYHKEMYIAFAEKNPPSSPPSPASSGTSAAHSATSVSVAASAPDAYTGTCYEELSVSERGGDDHSVGGISISHTVDSRASLLTEHSHSHSHSHRSGSTQNLP